MSRSLLAVVLLLAFTTPCSGVDAFRALRRSRTENPVPDGYTKPLIDTSGGAPDKDTELATLASILNKEPAAASSNSGGDDDPNNPNNPLYDNDVDQPQDQDSKNERAKVAYQKEANQLKNLIKQGTSIIKILPEKQKRLTELENKLKTLQGASNANAASDNLAKQQDLLKSVQSKSSELSDKLTALKATQAKLEASIKKVQASSGSDKPKFRNVRNEDDMNDRNENESGSEHEDGPEPLESEDGTDAEDHGKDLEDAMRE